MSKTELIELVAEKAGFGDVKYFMKTFKEETGLSPTEWKKVHGVSM